ncbi:hypothetical protein V1525DRAFT_427617 [Lipomyces kononenkoae]|uniref:Uncharacterized protein n=1 Tax=Lipomyces kononenkoae TaxID=34357 RepID=A0ACC3SWE1_LIPKO
MRLPYNIVHVLPLISLAAAQTTVHLSNTVSNARDLFYVRVERLDDLTNFNGHVSVQKTTSLTYAYDLTEAEHQFTSTNAPVRLDPTSTGQVSSYSIRDRISRTVAVDDVVGDIALAVAPLSNGAKRVTIALVVNAVNGNQVLKQDVLNANVKISNVGKILHVDTGDSNIMHVKVESFPVKLTGGVVSCAGNNQYWCKLMGAARSAKSSVSDAASKIFSSNPSGAARKQSTTQAHDREVKKGCQYSHGKKYDKNEHAHDHPHRAGGNESTPNLINGTTHSLFTIAFPLLIGILTGSIVVLIAIGIADLYVNYCLNPIQGYETVIVTDVAINPKELAEFIDQRRSRMNPDVDRKLSFDSEYDSSESHPLMK